MTSWYLPHGVKGRETQLLGALIARTHLRRSRQYSVSLSSIDWFQPLKSHIARSSLLVVGFCFSHRASKQFYCCFMVCCFLHGFCLIMVPDNASTWLLELNKLLSDGLCELTAMLMTHWKFFCSHMTCVEQYNTSACTESRYCKAKHGLLDDYELLNMQHTKNYRHLFFSNMVCLVVFMELYLNILDNLSLCVHLEKITPTLTFCGCLVYNDL